MLEIIIYFSSCTLLLEFGVAAFIMDKRRLRAVGVVRELAGVGSGAGAVSGSAFGSGSEPASRSAAEHTHAVAGAELAI